MTKKPLGSFSDLLGHTIAQIEWRKNWGYDRSDELIFTLEDGEKYKLYHDQDCCESVLIEDIAGDLESVLRSAIQLAEVVSNSGGVVGDGTYTWTFYKLVTHFGTVTIRWYGTSNGYYSEEVRWAKVDD